MKKTVIILVMMLNVMVLYAQNITIKGVVVDKNTEEKLSFANVMQMSDSSASAKLICGTTSNEKGEFALEVKQKDVVLKVNFLGYKDVFLAVNQRLYPIKNQTIDLGTIYLETDAQALGEVSIIGKQTRIEMNQDKIVMNVDDGVSATSANVFEMLRKVPGVVIDKDENITLQGQSNVLFQFDGRDIRIPYSGMKSILKGMSPNMVEKIETITNPSSKYEAEGTAGIINIVMAKEKATGFSGDAHSWSGINEDFKNNTGVSLNWVTNRWTISSGLSATRFASRTMTQMDQYIWGFGSDTSRIHSDETITKNNFTGLNFNLSADYKVNNNSSLGAMFSFDRNWIKTPDSPLQLMQISKSPYTTIDSSYAMLNDNDLASSNFMGSLYFNKRLDTIGGQYTISFDYNHNIGDQTSTSNNYYYRGLQEILQRQENLFNDGDNKYDAYSLKVDVVKPFNSQYSIEFGAKTRLAIVDNDFSATINDVLDENRTQAFKYKENVSAAYVSFSDKMTDKFSFRIGLRAEHTYTSFDLRTTNENYDNSYFSLFPSLTLNQRIGKMDNLSLSYTYRISRPDYNSLNPFVTKLSDYSYSTGNPYLDPEYTHKVSLNYAFHYLVFLTASYGYTNNQINQTAMANTSTLAITQKPYNNGYSQDFNIGLSSMLPLGPVEWTLWLQGAYQQAKCDDSYLQVDLSRFSFMTWQSLAVDFFFKTKLSVSCFYSTGGVQMGGEYDGMLMLSANLTKDFLNNNLKVSIGVDNLPKRDFHINAYNRNYLLDMNMRWQYPQFTFNITYTFGKAANNNTLKRIQADDMDSRSSGESSTMKGQGQITQ